MGNQVAILMRRAPYGTVYTAEGLRTLMGIGVFEMDISVLYVDDGVYALLKAQNPRALDMKPLGDAFPTLGDFGVNKFYVHDESLVERGLTREDLVMDVQIVDGARIAEIMAGCGKIVPF